MATSRTVTYEGREVSVPIPDFPYVSFNPEIKEFRLLTLDLNGSNDDTVKGDLSHYNLDEHPTYTALSYEWGDPSQVSWIIVNSTAFPVTENLETALQSLRAQKCPVVWIDAICIDQTDEMEKAAHIPIMTEIYHEAESVCAWIGPERDGSDKVLDILRAMDVSRKASVAGTPWKPDIDVINRHEEHLLAFLNRTYWRRVWIVQELSVASRIYILCGSKIVQWAGLELLLSWLRELFKPEAKQDKGWIVSWFEAPKIPTTNHLNGKADFSIDFPAFIHMTRLLQSRSYRFEGRPVGLLENLLQTAGSKATDSRDKVFGLLGLSFDRANFVKQPSYRCTEGELALDMTTACIWSRKSLDIIFLTGSTASDSRDLSTPSWCPSYLRLGEAAYSDKLCTYLTGHDERYRLGIRGIRWQATGDSVASHGVVRIDRNQCLITRGKRIGYINIIGPTLDGTLPAMSSPPDHATQPVDHATIISALNQALNFYTRDYAHQSTNKTLLQYIFSFDGDKYNPTQVLALKNRFHRIRKWREANGNLPLLSGSSTTLRHAATASGYLSPQTVTAVRTVSNGLILASRVLAATQPRQPNSTRNRTSTAQQRAAAKKPIDHALVDALQTFQGLIQEDMRFVSTSGAGEFRAGWAHHDARPGDEVFLLTGCSMPAILRRVDGGYVVVGHAFLSGGIMDGAFWGCLPREEVGEVVIC